MLTHIRLPSSLGIHCRLRRKGKWGRALSHGKVWSRSQENAWSRTPEALERIAKLEGQISQDGKWIVDYMDWVYYQVSVSV